MVHFIDAKTNNVLHYNVNQPENHLFHIGNKIEITDKAEGQVKRYRIIDIVIPYTFSNGIFGGLHGTGLDSKIFLELISAQSIS